MISENFDRTYIKLTKVYKFVPVVIIGPQGTKITCFLREQYVAEFKGPPTRRMKAELCDYIYNHNESMWTKVREPVAPLTEAEALLYAEA